MQRYLVFLIFFILAGSYSCIQKKSAETMVETSTPEIDMDKLIAWCIVPFDIKERTPQQRIEMLKELGFKSYAYDWRTKHLPEMSQEWILAKDNGINVCAVWMWIGTNTDHPGQLSESNEILLKTIKETGLKTQIWVGVQESYFENVEENIAIEKATEMVRYLCQRVEEVGGELALYNHGGWFGEPENQVKVIENLKEYKIGIIYNFHYGHDHINRFPEVLSIMKPYLYTVNLNGMKKEGPMILPFGEGDYEKQMLKTLIDSGYDGPLGIVGLVEDADVKVILKQNLKGYSEIIQGF
ncbi:sugar phosphate isomerase/epimerase family protein [Bacteroidota bacterium]